MLTLGRHVLVDLYGCNLRILDQPEALERIMLRSCELIGATVIARHFHLFSPHGVSGVVLIAESHLAIHSWPESSYAAADLYTCGDLDPLACIDHLAREIEARSYRVFEVLRGLPEHLAGRAPGAAAGGRMSVLAAAKELPKPSFQAPEGCGGRSEGKAEMGNESR